MLDEGPHGPRPAEAAGLGKHRVQVIVQPRGPHVPHHREDLLPGRAPGVGITRTHLGRGRAGEELRLRPRCILSQ
ncbi:hypothetical protein [Streptomyces sp. NRRL F-5630]|uniref:hypothetical protein n=1 Tax=Streptomyces sp. NRRL F-5630 TaxID=1463864 RepID=UPI003EC13A57